MDDAEAGRVGERDVSTGTVVLHGTVGAVIGFLLVGLLGSLVAMATPVRAALLMVLGIVVAAVFAWLAVRRARGRSTGS
jgi:hypothetical protein